MSDDYPAVFLGGPEGKFQAPTSGAAEVLVPRALPQASTAEEMKRVMSMHRDDRPIPPMAIDTYKRVACIVDDPKARDPKAVAFVYQWDSTRIRP